MDAFSFAASLIQSLAWPAAVIIIVCLFRQRLIELLPNIRLKHKDTELSFRLDIAEQEAKKLPPPEAVPELPPQTAEEHSRFEQLVEISPRAAILELRSELQEAVNSLLELSGVYFGTSLPSLAGGIRVLRNEGVVDSQTGALCDDLRVIGNQVAHGGLDEEPTREDAMRFKALADQVLPRLEAAIWERSKKLVKEYDKEPTVTRDLPPRTKPPKS